MISRSMKKSRLKHLSKVKSNIILTNLYMFHLSISTLLILIALIHATQSTEQQNEQPSFKPIQNDSLCPKAWVRLGQKCYKIMTQARNLGGAKSRCLDLMAQLTLIEDESAKEKESTSSIISRLISTDQSRNDLQSKQFYVSLSSDVIQHFHDRVLHGLYPKSDTFDQLDPDMSDLWLAPDDPSVVNITMTSSEKPNSVPAYVLAYSRRWKRWGLVQVPSQSRKLPFICERPINQSAAQPNQPVDSGSSPELKKPSDLNTQASSSNIQRSSVLLKSSSPSPNQNPEPAKSHSLDISTTPAPEITSALFRELPQDQSVILGSTAEMRCSPIDSESHLSWTFNGRNLTQSNRIKISSSGSMRIEHVRNTDDGNYTCTIHSGGMSESKSVRLEIIERPHQPEYISAELLDKLSTSVRIKWAPGFNGNSPITKYLVEMRTVTSDNIDADLQTIIQSNAWEVAKANISTDQTSVIIPDLKPARKYIFRIKATNRVGTGDPSLPTRPPIEVPVQPPSQAPENLTGSPKSPTSIVVQWTPPPVDAHNGPLKGYKIRHKLAGYASDADWYSNEVSDAAHMTFILDDLIIWQNYEIQVAAENDKGVGPFSPSIFVRTKEGKPDKGPRFVIAEALSSRSIRVSWKPPPPQHINGINQGYKVQVWTDMLHSDPPVKEKTVPHNTISPEHSVIMDDLLPYTEYYVTVNCYTIAGDGPHNENLVKVITKQDLPEAVIGLEFSDIIDKSLKIAWKQPKRINGELDHYTIEYYESSSPDKKVTKKIHPSANEARITDLSPQTSYMFEIYPYTNVGRGPVATGQVTTSVPPVRPEPPTNLEISYVEAYAVTIKFDPGFDGNAKIDKWIAESLSPTGNDHFPSWQQIYVSTNHSRGTSVVVRNLRPFTRYKIRLSPVNVVGPSKFPSEPTIEFQTAQVEPEQAPKDLVIENIKPNSVVARWLPLLESQWLGIPKYYNLTWMEGDRPFSMHTLINDTRADTFTVSDLEEYTEYNFRIFAVNEVGSSPASETVSVTTSEGVPSSSPNNITANALSSNTISIDWSSVPKRHRNGIIRGYKIRYQAAKPAAIVNYKVIDDNSTKHTTLNDLKAFTPYQLAIAAYTNAGDGVYSSALNVRTYEDTPGSPQNLSCPKVTRDSARILWDPPEETNGEVTGYKVSYHAVVNGVKEPLASHELNQNERTFKAANLKPDTNYIFYVAAKTKEGWGQQNNVMLYTHDSELRENMPFFRETWFTILCASMSVVITIIVTALLYIQTKSYKYKQSAIKSTSQDRLGDAGFTIDDDTANHYNNNGFNLLSNNANHRRSNGALSQSTANFTLPKSPPRPHPGSVVYSDDGDDDVFEAGVSNPNHLKLGPSTYDSSDSLAEKPSEISSSTPPESVSADEEYANMTKNPFANHYANVNGTIRGHRSWHKKSTNTYASHKANPKLPQRPAPSMPQVPCEPTSSGSDGNPIPGPSGLAQSSRVMNSYNGIYDGSLKISPPSLVNNPQMSSASQYGGVDGKDTVDNPQISHETNRNSQMPQKEDLLNHNGHTLNLNGGRIIVDNMAGSRAPLPGFTSFV